MEYNIGNIVEIQRCYFETGATRPISQRKFLLKKLKNCIICHENEIITALNKDLSKCEFEAYASEILLVYKEIDLHIKKLNRWAATSYQMPSLLSFPSINSVRREPRGVVLIISPWNYPFNLLFMPLIGALSAGCTAILKPSPMNKALNVVVEKIITECFFQKEVAVINGGAEIMDSLLGARYDYIFYTGSENFGREVMRRAADNLTPVTLELGGKSPAIVHKDANLKAAARRIIWGKLLNAGQTCVAPDYLFVHESVINELILLMVSEIETMYSVPIKNCEDYGRIISIEHTRRIESMIEEVRSKIIYGGNVSPEERFAAPTLIIDPPMDSKVMQEEIFSPILPIHTYNSIDEPISYINSRPHPLALYYFGNSRKDINKVIGSTQSGGVCINDTVVQVATQSIPFGGIGNSGMGSYHGIHSFNTFTHQRSVVRSFSLEIKLKYAPYKNKVAILRKLIK